MKENFRLLSLSRRFFFFLNKINEVFKLAYVLMYTRGLCQHSFATGTEAVWGEQDEKIYWMWVASLNNKIVLAFFSRLKEAQNLQA